MRLCPHPYMTGKVSNTVIWAPPCNTGQRLAVSTAASSESALIMEYPLAIVPTGPSLTVPSLAMRFAIGVNGLPWSTRALESQAEPGHPRLHDCCLFGLTLGHAATAIE